MNSEWLQVDSISRFLSEKLGAAPEVVLVLGSGLKDAAFGMTNQVSIGFDEIPGWPKSTVAGHHGMLKRGTIQGKEVLLQLGRVHLYEGYSVDEVVRPTRSLVTWGASKVVVTNAAGGIGEYLKPGGLMLIEDQLNLTGRNPLVGPNDDARGDRFPDMTAAYSRRLCGILTEEANRLQIDLKKGAYAGLLGPSYETPAEVKMLRVLGADAVGMSTVLEVIAARHLRAEVAGISCISNMAASTEGPTLSHDDVQVAAAQSSADLARLLVAMVAKL